MTPLEVVRLAVCGDVMLGRGVDQILPHPGDPTLRERYVEDARDYVRLAERVNGPIPRPVDVAWPWGEALTALLDPALDVRIINLETSVTRRDEFADRKAVHYRMDPDNLGALTVARPDVCTLANNHVLDFGRGGLDETLEALSTAGLGTAGAGRDVHEARRPAVVTLEDGRGEGRPGGRILVLAMGTPSSGIPTRWAATGDRSGVALLTEPSDHTVVQVLERLERWKQADDLVVASLHWGSNWGYEVPADHTRFAHALIEGGVDVVHGHSSHHPRPIEVHRDRLILYGCGDFIDDYEGIAGHERYRDDLRLLYLVDLDAHSGELVDLRMVPFQARRMRLEHASPSDIRWLASVLDRTSRDRGARVVREADDLLALRRS